MTLTHQLSLFDLLADFQEDDDISNEEILKVLTQMENETSVVTVSKKNDQNGAKYWENY